MPKQNEYYTSIAPLRLTEKQDAELRLAAKGQCVTVNQYVRDSLVENGTISAGPAPKARKGFGKKGEQY